MLKKANPAIAPRGVESLQMNGDEKIGVDFAKRLIRGRVVAELGPFKSKGRGEFNMESLEKIVELGNQSKKGLRSRFKHPSMSDDGLGKHLGRDRNFRLDGNKVRSDFYLEETAFKVQVQGGGISLGQYVMELANNDPGALSSSLVLDTIKEYRRNPDGTLQRDESGESLPPVWKPTTLFAIDVVDTGDAVNDFLSMEQLSENDQFVRKGVDLVRQFFGESVSRDVLDQRLGDFKNKIVLNFFGEDETMSTAAPAKPTEEQKPIQGQLLEANGLDLSPVVEALNKQSELLTKLIEGSKKTEEPKTQDEGDYATKVASLCQLQNHPELIQGFLSNKTPIDAVKDQLLQLSAKERALPGGAPVTEPTKPAELSEEEKLGKEWEENKDVYLKMGLPKSVYCRKPDAKKQLASARQIPEGFIGTLADLDEE